MGLVQGIVYRAIATHLIKKAGETGKRGRTGPGSIVVKPIPGQREADSA